MSNIQLKRVYEAAEESDGTRVLIDRLWPRGISKDHAVVSHWLRNVAPSAELRKWFNHDPDKFEEFRDKYMAELEKDSDAKEAVKQLKAWADAGKVTLVYGAKDEKHNQAVVLEQYLHRL